jgi:hypothetical protein
VNYETDKALQAEKDSDRQILIPIMLDDSIFKQGGPWLDKVKQHFIVNFKGCKSKKNEKYQVALERLLVSLQAERLKTPE